MSLSTINTSKQLFPRNAMILGEERSGLKEIPGEPAKASVSQLLMCLTQGRPRGFVSLLCDVISRSTLHKTHLSMMLVHTAATIAETSTVIYRCTSKLFYLF